MIHVDYAFEMHLAAHSLGDWGRIAVDYRVQQSRLVNWEDSAEHRNQGANILLIQSFGSKQIGSLWHSHAESPMSIALDHGKSQALRIVRKLLGLHFFPRRSLLTELLRRGRERCHLQNERTAVMKGSGLFRYIW